MSKELYKLCIGDTKDFTKSGVYTIHHEMFPEKLYVGSASAKSYYSGFYGRWYRHYKQLKARKHHNIKLQKVIDKYGIEGLRFEILEICDSKYCVSFEQYWMNFLNPYYNIVRSAHSTLGYKHTEEYLNKVRKKVLQYDLNGDFLKEWRSLIEASKETGIDKSAIQSCCSGNNMSSGNFMWKYKTQEDFEKKISPYSSDLRRPVLCYDKDGKFVKKFGSILEAAKHFNIPVGNICHNLKGKLKVCYGYRFMEYKNDNYPLFINSYERKHKNQISIDVLDLETNESLHFSSMREAGKMFSRCQLSSYVKNGDEEFVYKKKYKVKITKLIACE
jgi:group I intron endonuclease